MKITPDDVAAIARLARLDLSRDTLERFAGQLAGILEHMDKLAELDTEDVAPMSSPVDQVGPLRPDEVVSHCTRQEILANAPRQDGVFFIVPKIV